ncbi:SpaA isopeptide-forming pilin-related protein [Kitasatospora sp. SUK 42]|uniref:SpaA isopeptide-forming pilin-related protein n=1 Tax=Kitasatospora sp. SUK 42 TaxID=1588882 RepID=UPI001C312399|nr:SpaA isopeptide-forming pilin-related protein [Kitasatospora sp. SUK 42]MBV2155412.1 choice-of-anchor A family protein [Kitasatospora sp. SUK 42]
MSSALALTLAPFGMSLIAPTAAEAAGLPGGLGPCLGADCPATFPPVNNGPFAGRDAGVNIFVGGDFNVSGSAAEAEGHVVTLGNFSQNKAAGASSVYNIGIVGVGSRVPPPDGADFLTAGGNVTIARGQTLLADGGVVRYAGTASGNITGTTIQDAQAVAAYRPLRSELQSASECYAGIGVPRPATGTAVNQGYQTLFTGDGTSALQVFNVDFDIAGTTGGAQGIAFANIPANATILVNLVGGARTINTYSGSLEDTDPWNQLRERLLWNFPTASTVTLTGSGQFQGSVLVGNPASTATMNLPGLNGRFFTTGSLLHNSGSGMTGTEFHAYPFDGDLPDCGNPPAPTGSTSVTKVDSVTGQPLAGAVFQLWRETNGVPGLQTSGTNPDTEVGAPCTTGADGVCSTTDLPLGTYYWQETQAPPGYDLPRPAVTTVVLDTNGQNVPVTVPDTKSPVVETGSTSVTKVDSATNQPLAGATFQLWRETNGVPGLQTTGRNPDTAVGAPCVTPANGVCSATDLPLGTYYWQETAAPPGYDLPELNVTTVVLDTNGQTVAVTVADTQTAAPTASTSVTKVDSATGQPLAGATFQLWRETNGVPGLQTTGSNPDTAVGSPCITPATGVCSAADLPLGTYYWQEVSAPDGYDLPELNVTTVVLDTNGQTVAVTVADTKTVAPTGSTSVTKVDSVTGQPLAGATFQLWRETNGVPGLQTSGSNPDTAVGSPCITPATGVCSATGLPLGTYYWQETAAPPGYDLPQSSVTTVVLDTNGQDIPVTVKDTKSVAPTGSTSVTKVDSVTGQPLAGAVFQLWHETNGVPGLQTGGPNPDTAIGSPCVTPDTGVCSADNLPLGTYYWEETTAPPGYELPQPAVTTVVLSTNGQNVPVTVKDTKSAAPTGSTSVTKVDSVTGRPLAGAVFQLWRETNGVPGLQTSGSNPDTKVGAPCTTGADGVCSAADLPLGTYYWQEVSAPPGYDLPQPSVTTVVLSTNGQNVPITVSDTLSTVPTGSTSVTKVDAETGQPLAGAVFQLWHETNGVPGLQTSGANPDTKVGAPCTTGADGVCSAAGLPLGIYYWQEVSAPPGYELPQPSVTTVVLSTNGQNVPVTVKDSKKSTQTGSTSVTKVDAETGQPLAGAVFQLWRETNGVPGLQTSGSNPDTEVGAPCTTGADGVCSATDLPLGTYYWQEVSAPDGYQLPKHAVTKVELTKDCPCVEITVKDKKCPPKPCPPEPCEPGKHEWGTHEERV